MQFTCTEYDSLRFLNALGTPDRIGEIDPKARVSGRPDDVARRAVVLSITHSDNNQFDARAAPSALIRYAFGVLVSLRSLSLLHLAG